MNGDWIATSTKTSSKARSRSDLVTTRFLDFFIAYTQPSMSLRTLCTSPDEPSPSRSSHSYSEAWSNDSPATMLLDP
eukprot:COSAG04_NODE_6221_length_1381_cov_0.632605_2_plen_76_part_01